MKRRYKILLTVTLAVTLLATIFILPASAVDLPDIPDIETGIYVGNQTPDLSDWDRFLTQTGEIVSIYGIDFYSNPNGVSTHYIGLRLVAFNGYYVIQYQKENNQFDNAYRSATSQVGWVSGLQTINLRTTIDGWDLTREEFGFFTVVYEQVYSGSEYDVGYREGLEDGQEIGYIDGYNAGFNDGKATTGSDGILPEFFSGVFEALDRFTFFEGFTLLDFIKGILAIFALIWFLKLLAGG